MLIRVEGRLLRVVTNFLSAIGIVLDIFIGSKVILKAELFVEIKICMKSIWYVLHGSEFCFSIIVFLDSRQNAPVSLKKSHPRQKESPPSIHGVQVNALTGRKYSWRVNRANRTKWKVDVPLSARTRLCNISFNYIFSRIFGVPANLRKVLPIVFLICIFLFFRSSRIKFWLRAAPLRRSFCMHILKDLSSLCEKKGVRQNHDGRSLYEISLNWLNSSARIHPYAWRWKRALTRVPSFSLKAENFKKTFDNVRPTNFFEFKRPMIFLREGKI